MRGTVASSDEPSVQSVTDAPAVPRWSRPRTSGTAGSDAMPSGRGRLCLDFLATVEEGADRSLPSDDAFAHWLAVPGLPVPVGGITDDDLALARALRSAIDNAARSLLAGSSVSAADVRCINVFAEHATPVFLLRAGGRGRTAIAVADARPALAVIARDAVHLFTDGDIGRLRECARSGCGRLFFDRSPSGRRRWCSMKGCGEIVASASYRNRQVESRSHGRPA